MSMISVIICSFNPDLIILERVLDAIDEACKRCTIKEFLIIDNNSIPPLVETKLIQTYITRNPKTRVISEPRQGLTYARLSGITHSSGELVIFIDDDNIIRNDFLFESDRIFNEFPYIGAFSGQVQLIYDEEPPAWTKKYWGMLVHRLFLGNKWGNLYFENDIMPNGAGLCLRREVALHYKSVHESGHRVIILDRSADSLLSGGDNDLAMCACDIGLGMGLFEQLYLYHYIPPSRFTLSYLAGLTQGIYYSHVMLKYMRNCNFQKISYRRKLFELFRSYLMDKEDRVIMRAMYHGLEKAYSQIGYESKGKYA